MSVRVRATCDHKGCDLFFDTPLFDDIVSFKEPSHWDVVLPGPTQSGITLCPWHSRFAKITCEGCKRMDGQCECEVIL